MRKRPPTLRSLGLVLTGLLALAPGVRAPHGDGALVAAARTASAVSAGTPGLLLAATWTSTSMYGGAP